MFMSSIELKQLEFNFGTQDWGLENINLSIANQESFVMVGPSGGGKTVLLKLMAGLYQPLGGHLFIEGQDFHQLKIKQNRSQIKLFFLPIKFEVVRKRYKFAHSK